MNKAARFVLAHTAVTCAPLVPELSLRLATEAVPLWLASEGELQQAGVPAPYWAFAWAGGQALARYILDHPETVRDRYVLSFAAGSGIESIAACLAGARSVTANDIDPHAIAAIELNALLNGVQIETIKNDIVGSICDRWTVVLAGDICYEQPMAGRALNWLQRLAGKGALVLLGDPGRTYLPKCGLTHLANYAVQTTRELEDSDVRSTSVWRVCGLPSTQTA